MAYLSTFEQVENWYNRTQPVVSNLHTKADDIRPLGNRSRKHERIVKINRNCYALLGGYFHDGVAYTKWSKEYFEKHSMPRATPQELKRTAPIVWERRSDGREYVTIHNDTSPRETSWYEFLRRYLPSGMQWPHSRDGKQWLTVRGVNDTTRFFVPLNRCVPSTFISMRHYTDWVKGGTVGTAPRLERKLTFKRLNTPHPRWELVGDAYENPSSTRYHIDKEAKRVLKPQITEFKEWLRVVHPVLMERSGAEASAASREMCNYHSGWKEARFWGDWWRRHPDKVKDVLADPDSPGRVELAYQFRGYLRNCDWALSLDEQDDPSRFDARFNNFINIACGFRKQNKGES